MFLKIHVPTHCTIFEIFDWFLLLRTQRLFDNFELEFFFKGKYASVLLKDSY